VKLTSDAPSKDRYVLLAADPDLFNRWEAGQDLARDLILARAAGAPDEVGEERFAAAVGRALADQSAEPAFKALMLALPSEADLAQAVDPVDPAALHDAREALRTRLAIHLGETLRRLHGGLQEAGEFSVDASAAGRRALHNAALELLAADRHADIVDRALGHFRAAANMTDAMGGLSALMLLGGPAFDTALAEFFERWRSEPLVIDKWFAVQARSPGEDVLGRVLGLTAHPMFDSKNPNRLRALVQSFASGNPHRFHDASGAGYRFLADQILAVDGFNPMTAARLIEPLAA
jgi:aminopeptidase N